MVGPGSGTDMEQAKTERQEVARGAPRAESTLGACSDYGQAQRGYITSGYYMKVGDQR